MLLLQSMIQHICPILHSDQLVPEYFNIYMVFNDLSYKPFSQTRGYMN